MKRIMLLLSLFLILPIICQAATGDIIATDLLDTASTTTLRSRNVVSEGCYPGGTGECVKMDCADGNCFGTDGWVLDIPDTKEITISWYERYNVWPLQWSLGGAKSIRPYHGPDSSDYMAGLMTYHSAHGYSGGLYLSTFQSAKLNMNYPYATSYNDYNCTSVGSYSADCSTRMGVEWSPDGGTTDGMGTAWRKMRMHILMPTSYTSGDGQVTMWVDDNLIFTLDNIDMHERGGLTTTRISFAPVDETATPHEHWYDEIIVYEGYVPPRIAGIPTRPQTPTGFRIVLSAN